MFTGVLNWFRRSEQAKNPPNPPVPRGKTPEELAQVVRELIQQVDAIPSSGKFQAFLVIRSVREAELVSWLRTYGESLSAAEVSGLIRLLDVMNPPLATVIRELNPNILATKQSRNIPDSSRGNGALQSVRDLLQQGDLEQALALLELERSNNSQNPVKVLEVEVEILELEVQIREAFLRQNEALEELAWFWFMRGQAHFENNHFLQALEAYGQALAIKPSFWQAWYDQGACFGNVNRTKEALDCYQQASKYQPERGVFGILCKGELV